MVSYVNVHGILEGRRGRAKKSPSDDPVLSQVILLCLVVRRLDALMCLFMSIIFFVSALSRHLSDAFFFMNYYA